MRDYGMFLLPEPQIAFCPSQAARIGINQAIILNQVHYWLLKSENWLDGHYWVYNTYEAWAGQFLWLTANAIKKHMLELEKAGYLMSREPNRGKGIRQKWYTINYDLFPELKEFMTTPPDPSGGIARHRAKSNDHRAEAHYGSKAKSSVAEKPLTTTVTTNKPEGIEEPNKGIVHGIFEIMRRYLGYPEKTEKDPIPNYGVEGKAIKRLLMRGFTAAEVLDYWKKRVDARKGFVSMVYINQDIGGPAKSGRAAPVEKHYGLPGESDLERQAREKGIAV